MMRNSAEATRIIGIASVAVWGLWVGWAVPEAMGQCLGWKAVGPVGGTNGTIYAAHVFDDGTGPALYLGGYFGIGGSAFANNIVKWNGSTWMSLGSGVENGTDDAVLALTVLDGGNDAGLYAGGYFIYAGSVEANNIARWSGSAWLPVGTGMASSGGVSAVFALAEYNGRLIAGGYFDDAGGASVSNIAQWTGSAWEALGNVTAEGVDGPVYALAVYNGKLIVGGDFNSAGGVVAHRVAQWNGTSWSGLGVTPKEGTDAIVWALAAQGTMLFAGGDFLQAGGASANYVAQWDGASWSALNRGEQNGVNDSVEALAVFNDGTGPAIYAGGHFVSAAGISANHIAKWNGAAWSSLGSGVSSTGSAYVDALTSYNDELIVAGEFALAGGEGSERWARWGVTGQFVAADFVPDCHVDHADLDVFLGCFTGPGVSYYPNPPAGCTLHLDASHRVSADFDLDGDVDMRDFAIFQRCYSGTELVNPDCIN